MSGNLGRSYTLLMDIVDFVLDAEGELAQALETYAAQQMRKGFGTVQQDFIIDGFLVEGNIGSNSPLKLYLQAHPELDATATNLINTWHRSFIGLFAIKEILTDGLELMNWLTEKVYIVKPNNPQTTQDISRFQVGEIILTRIFPVTKDEWTFSRTLTQMGKLGKPKLAVAIGNFKDNYPQHLYSDAPELLEQAWQSVNDYHQQFVDFFGTDMVTMPGYQLNKKIAELQAIMTEKRLQAAGIDSSKSLAEIAQEAGVTEADITANATEIGVDNQAISQLLQNKLSLGKMVTPKVDLPAEFKQAEQLTVLSHPRWGQMFLPTYSQITEILTTSNTENLPTKEKLIRQYLEDKKINSFVWQKLASDYPEQLEKALQEYLKKSDFKLSQDLDLLLTEFHKPLEPELPEIASVPEHLHNLFQAAFAEVNKSKSKSKSSKPISKGFQSK
uniref:hypothetical protein n=2 Tax=Calothrix sp. 336/3 TaxID=1337936 RepID=UPI0004E3333C|nr:hypothetical protein [Calothrix sp. 336/3]